MVLIANERELPYTLNPPPTEARLVDAACLGTCCKATEQFSVRKPQT